MCFCTRTCVAYQLLAFQLNTAVLLLILLFSVLDESPQFKIVEKMS